MAKVDDIFSALDCGDAKPDKVKTKAKPLKSEAQRKKDESKLYMDGIAYLSQKRQAEELAPKIRELRDSLLERTETEGVEIDDRHKELSVGNMQFRITYREGSSMDLAAAETLLKKRQLYEQAVTPQLDPDKIMDLYRQKKLTKKDIDSIVKLNRTPALEVKMAEEKKEKNNE